MFLNELNKSEGISFIQLVRGLIMADNVFAEEEKVLYNDYLKELGLEEGEVPSLDLESVCEKLMDSSERVRNIIYFELVGLALIDGEYAELEVSYLEKVSSSLGINELKRTAFEKYFENLVEVYKFTVVDADSKIELLKEQAEKILA